MKKFALYLLAGCLLLACCGCGNQTDTDPTAAADEPKIVTWESPCLVQVKFNPEFAFALDSGNAVTAVYLLNTDAEALFAGEDVTGQGLDRALWRFIDVLYENGYFTDIEPHFDFTVKAETGFDTAAVTGCIDATAASFLDNTGIALTVSTALQTDADRQLHAYTAITTGSDRAEGPGERPAEEPGERPAEEPAGGESLATPAEVGDEERDDEWLRDPSITVERDSDGNIVKYIRAQDNWVEEFNADKTLIKTASYRADGTVEEERFYDAAGNITREVYRDPTVGQISEITYSGGVKTTVVTTNPDSTMTTTYRANGSRIREELVFSNGNKSTRTYSEADLFTYVCNITQGGNVVWEIFYDANGNPATGTINAEGIISTLIYQPDGGYEQWFTSPEGYEVYNKFAADGSVIICLIGDDAPPRP